MIEINQVSNGYIVRDNISAKNTTMVFQTMAELLNYISEHFTHRQQEVLTDGPF
jgi:hemerythrin